MREGDPAPVQRRASALAASSERGPIFYKQVTRRSPGQMAGRSRRARPEDETDTVLSSIIRSQQEWRSAQYAVMPLRQQIEKEGVPL